MTCFSVSHILGFPTEELLRGHIIRKELQEQLSRQMSSLHLLHWCVFRIHRN